MARGLVLDIEKQEIVALPFPKFYNYGEVTFDLPNEPFQAYEKYDGSLGIAYYYNNQWYVVTKGSFTSNQSIWATKHIRSHVPSFMIPGNTYLFELIYPENKIVVRYNEQMMVLLAAYNNVSGEEFLPEFPDEGIYRNPHIYNYSSIDEMIKLAKTLPPNKEGFVVRFQNGYRVKIKGKEYLEIHKAMSQITPVGVWRLLIMNQGWKFEHEFRKSLPEEILPDYLEIRNFLINKCESIYQKSYHLYSKTYQKVGQISDPRLRKKQFVEEVRQSDLFNFVMLIYCNTPEQGVRAAILRSIRPVGDDLDGRNYRRDIA